jgi:hypothetical protein
VLEIIFKVAICVSMASFIFLFGFVCGAAGERLKVGDTNE